MDKYDDFNLPFSKDPQQNYSDEFIAKRIEFLTQKTDAELKHIQQFSIDPLTMQGNIENSIGCVQVPVGVAGPLAINGNYARGNFYIPMATTEGALVVSCNRGARTISRCGGVNTILLNDTMHYSVFFPMHGLGKIKDFIDWVDEHFFEIKNVAEQTTRHGKLLEVQSEVTGFGVGLKFIYSTGDAMGLNMIAKSSYMICLFIHNKTGAKALINSNFSSDKKNSSRNEHIGYGKSLFAEFTLKKELIQEKNLKVTPEQLDEHVRIANLAGIHTGMVGNNCQVMNILAAIFIACGQDVAQTIHSSSAISTGRILDNGDFNCSISIPNLLVGTVGGGTKLATQNECLQLLGCTGKNSILKFAEIVAAALLAGEVGITLAISGGTFVAAHENLGRNRPS